MCETLLPPMGGGFRLAARLAIPDGGASGVLAALGDWHNGFAAYLVDGRPAVAFCLFGDTVRVAADAPLPPGARTVEVLFRRAQQGGGPLALRVDGEIVARGTIPTDLPFRWQIGGAGLLVGHDRGFPVCDDYRPPATFTGEIVDLTLDALGVLPRDVRKEIEALLRNE